MCTVCLHGTDKTFFKGIAAILVGIARAMVGKRVHSVCLEGRCKVGRCPFQHGRVCCAWRDNVLKGCCTMCGKCTCVGKTEGLCKKTCLF